MMLCIDIGNTNVVSALWDGNAYVAYNRFESSMDGVNDFKAGFDLETETIIISSVVPILTEAYSYALKDLKLASPFIITHKNCLMKLQVDFPSEVGADRICNSFGAKTIFGSPVVVVDFGSATTYDVVNESGAFIGGAIAPGIDVSAHNLIEKTALLKAAAFQFPENVVGTNTETNLQSGIMYSGVYAVDGMLNRIKSEMDWTDMNVVLTGGFSSLISPKLHTPHQLAPKLTLDGMRSIAEGN